MNPIREVRQRHTLGMVDDLSLLRALATWPAWQIPLTPDGRIALAPDDDGGAWMQLYSASGPAHQETVEIPGWELLPGLADGLSGVEIDPGTPEATHYRQDQLPLLRGFGRAVQIERLLRGELESDDPLRDLREHLDFTLLSSPGRRRTHEILLVPDDRGRRLAAVFTAWDAALAFLGEVSADPASVEPLSVDGATLFAWLRDLDLEGMVFNPSGPGAPIPAAMTLADQVLGG